MKFSDFIDYPVIDCHIHLWVPGHTLTRENLLQQAESLVEIIDKGNIKQIYTTGGDAGIFLKTKYPNLFYAGGSMPWGFSPESVNQLKIDWKKYINELIEVGFDGVQEIGSKPRLRDRRITLDNPHLDDLWSACENFDFAVLLHVADPEEFWDEKLIPNWAKAQDWGYYKGDWPTKKELYTEMENILNNHPDLKAVLCHFYFMSADLEKASDFFDRHEKAHFDLSLGIELMHNISHRRDEYRDFFIKYSNRILYGTDIGMSKTIQEHLTRIWLLRNFLESNEEFFLPLTADSLLTRYKEPFIGLNLPKATLSKIYYKNFQRLWGRRPRKIDIRVAVSRCERKGNAVLAEALKKPL